MIIPFVTYEAPEPADVQKTIPLDVSLDDYKVNDLPFPYIKATSEEIEEGNKKMLLPEEVGFNIRSNDVESTITSSKEKTYTSSELDISLDELIKQENLPIRVNRDYVKGARTASGNPSNHGKRLKNGHPAAYDISPTNGKGFEELTRILYNNSKFRAWLKHNGLGILPEVITWYPGLTKKTHATGNHFHIGPDTLGKNWWYDGVVPDWWHGGRNTPKRTPASLTNPSKAQHGMKFNIPQYDNQFPFVHFENAEQNNKNTQIDILGNTIDISDWAQEVLPNGRIIVKNEYQQEPITEDSYTADFPIIEEESYPEEKSSKEVVSSKELPKTEGQGKRLNLKVDKKGEQLYKYIKEVSNEAGFEGLKDPNIQKIIMMQAERESGYNQKITTKASSGCGYFGMLDMTRNSLSNASRKEFLNDGKEQVRAAYKLYKWIHSLKSAKELKKQGYNDELITVLGWWYPKSLQMVLNGKRKFSLGGYSIQKAFKDYGK